MKKKAAVLIPTYNRAHILKASLRELVKNNRNNIFDIYVIDNGSTDDTSKILRAFDTVKYMTNERNYFASKALNILFKKFNIAKHYEFLVIMAHDVLVDKDTIPNLISFLQKRPDIGITAPIYFEFDTNKFRTCGLSISHWTSLLKNHTLQNTEGIDHFVSCFAMRSQLYSQINGLNYVLFPMIYEEPDIGERVLRKGKKLVPCLSAKIWHPVTPGKKPGYKDSETQLVHERMYGNKAKAYLFFRNRVIFMSLYSNMIQFLGFYLFINPFISLYYIRMIDITLLKQVLMGLFDGTIFAFTKNVSYIAKRNKIVLNM